VVTRKTLRLKHRRVFDALQQEMRSGRLRGGDRLPSEADLVRTFGVSRITAGRAVRDLQAAGLVERRVGSGTYVKAAPATGGLSFGLLIPDLGETDVFEPICQGMMASPAATEHVLLLGSGLAQDKPKEERAWELCRRYVDRRVAGVFFAPVEGTVEKDDVNRRIVETLDAAGIPVVLLDRPALPYPARSHHDLVGIDNRRAGESITSHLLQMGARRIGFVAVRNTAATVDAREAGYREALYAADAPIERALAQRLDPADAGAVRAFLTASRADAVVCANDWTAARFMHTALALGYKVPFDVRLAGIDDMDYASLLPVPLTTVRQPTREIGAAAFAAMLDRVARPGGPPRDILLQTELVVRQSCGPSTR
jgi:GntR family transcriptional regulator of arabinose operon